MQNGFDTDFLYNTMKELCSTINDEDVKGSCMKFARELATILNSDTPTTQTKLPKESNTKQHLELQKFYEEFEALSAVVSNLQTTVPDTDASKLQQNLEKLTEQMQIEDLTQDSEDSMEIQSAEDSQQSNFKTILQELKDGLNTVNLMEMRSSSAAGDLEKMVMVMEDRRQSTPSPLRTPRTSLNLTPQSTKNLRFFAKDVNLDHD